MNILQYEEAIYWIYDKLEATIANPTPSLRWVTEDPVVLQQNWPAGIEEMPVGELSNSLESLVKVFDLILNKGPVLTRVFLNTINTYLTHQDRLVKTTRLNNAYPNTEGLAAAADAYISLLEFMRACHSGAQIILYKHVSGVAWMTKWDSLKEQLHVCQSTIPKVTLDSAQRETLLN